MIMKILIILIIFSFNCVAQINYELSFKKCLESGFDCENIFHLESKLSKQLGTLIKDSCFATSQLFKKDIEDIPLCTKSSETIPGGISPINPSGGIFITYTSDNDHVIEDIINLNNGNTKINILVDLGVSDSFLKSPLITNLSQNKFINIIPTSGNDRFIQDRMEFVTLKNKPAIYAGFNPYMTHGLACDLALACNIPIIDFELTAFNHGGALETMPGGTFYHTSRFGEYNIEKIKKSGSRANCLTISVTEI